MNIKSNISRQVVPREVKERILCFPVTLWITVFILFLSGCSACDPPDRRLFHATHALWFNYRGPFQGKVIDAVTRGPIQGAVVHVTWKVVPRPILFYPQYIYDAMEVLTDEAGMFSIPKKGTWNPVENFFMDSEVLIFKAGYSDARTDYWRNLNCLTGPQVLRIEHQGKTPTFLLDRFKTTDDWLYRRRARFKNSFSVMSNHLIIRELDEDNELRKSLKQDK